MDEAKWLNCAEPWTLMRMKHRATDRQLRLFAAACCRLVWNALPFEGCRQAVILGERFADDLANPAELAEALRALNRERTPERGVRARLSQATAFLLRPRCQDVARVALMARTGPRQHRLFVRQADRLRDIFGNPWRPLRPRSFPAHVLGLAQACDAAFPAVSPDFAILADALEELGEEQAAAHCRQDLHVKGCHILDWIMSFSR